jgi:uncharacterized protein YmfQ (DUF2313 family)
MPRSLTDNAQALLDELPYYERDAPEVEATISALSNEIDRIDAQVQVIYSDLFPQTADARLSWWEATLGLPVEPEARTLAQRQAIVLAYLRAIRIGGAGTSWEAALTQVLGTNWSYVEHAGTYTVNILVPFTAALPNPTGLSVTASGTTGTLPAGTYHYVISALSPYGETMASNDVSVTITAGQEPHLTWPAITGASGYQVYRGTDPLSAGTLNSPVLLVNLAAGTTAYIDDGTASPDSSERPPSANSTQSPLGLQGQQLARAITPAHLQVTFGYTSGFLVEISQVGVETL